MAIRRLGLIGYGAIGKAVCTAFAGDDLVKIPAVLARRVRDLGPDGPIILTEPEQFFQQQFDAVLEVAGHQALRDYGERVLLSGADLVVTSIGAFATDPELLERLTDAAARFGRRLIIASAGIGALDILSAAAVGGLDSVRMVVRKDPTAWVGTIAEEKFDLDAMTEPTVLFEGSAREGARLFPQNVNISAAVALAGLGLDKTHLTIIADTTITTHIIEVEAHGVFGSFRFVEDVVPTEDNPKTGKIVAMAVVKTVRQLASPLVIGL
ncbi:aspartate dehydrogenase [Oceanibaculum nanhaiense]|uniref:aspartate dehydrogenase n=1 Tax=Oceanibaculum nanhaiense TaxID=1909734 RepID=UPI003D2E1F09